MSRVDCLETFYIIVVYVFFAPFLFVYYCVSLPVRSLWRRLRGRHHHDDDAASFEDPGYFPPVYYNNRTLTSEELETYFPIKKLSEVQPAKEEEKKEEEDEKDRRKIPVARHASLDSARSGWLYTTLLASLTSAVETTLGRGGGTERDLERGPAEDTSDAARNDTSTADTTKNPSSTVRDPGENACPICLEQLNKSPIDGTHFDDPDVRLLPCRHLFHDWCIREWVLDCQAQCPLCRLDLAEYVETHPPPEPLPEPDLEPRAATL